VNGDGNYEYWLERSDPLVNTILPGTGVSLVVNFGERWAAGRSLATSAMLPRLAVFGPVTQARILRVGTQVQAVGAVLLPPQTLGAFGVPPSQLVDQIVLLEDLWGRSNRERLFESLSPLQLRQRLSTLGRTLVVRTERLDGCDHFGHIASRFITVRQARVSIEEMANRYGVNRQQFARKFSAATGMTPKLFARVTRFQTLVQALLSSEVSEWASVAPDVGYYDQAHMINDFREFAGSAPTVFFQPHDETADTRTLQLRGRPSEWRRSEPEPDSERRVARKF